MFNDYRSVAARAMRLWAATFMFSTFAALPSPAQEAQEAGLRLDPSGVLLKDGRPVQALGMNYMDAFTRCLKDPEDTSYRVGFETLAAHNIPFVRVNFGGFYPSDWSLYQNDPDRYFALMDGVVRAAEATNVGLVPSLFWWVACVPDLMGEPVGAWGDAGSKTHTFMNTYVTEVVTRYRDSRAIWAWELGNEYSLFADLPNAADTRPPIVPSRGTPETRGAADDLSSTMIGLAASRFAAAVRAVDPHRPVTTGHSLPRASAEHQRIELSWKADSAEEFRENLARVTPDPMNLISIHVYPHAKEHRFGLPSVPYSQILSESLRAARDAKKGLFIGEFGPPPDNEAPWTPDTAKEEGLALLRAIEESGAQLAAFWVFDFAWQEATHNVTLDNTRSFYLKALQEANQRIEASR